jgi:glutamate-1-semialdehyde 2,1-aminomutase
VSEPEDRLAMKSIRMRRASSTPPVTSAQFMERARSSLAGGDSSNMRVPPYHLPLVAARGDGSRVWDLDGNEYVDLNMAYGPLILGHRPQRVIDAVTWQIAERGSQLGFPTEISVRVAEKIKVLYPSIELLRFANSGTEAAASAARLARAVTGRRTLVLFEGHYHGWSDSVFNRYHADLSVLPERGYGPAISGPGGLPGALQDVIVARWNDLDLLERVLDEHGSSVAAVMMEPVMGNAGVVPPEPGFLLGARELTRAHGALLVFDEVITGMRVAAGGAQERYEVHPDITVIAKALGGGYPVAAFGASAELMEPIVEGRVFHGGVYSGNAIVMAAAEAVLDEILEHRLTMYRCLDEVASELVRGLATIMDSLGVPHVLANVGPMISLFLTDGGTDRIAEYRDARRHGAFARYIDFQHEAQRRGVYFHPNMFEPMYLSTAHTRADVGTVLERLDASARSSLAR